MYKVYKVEPQMHYHGMSLVAANNAEEANSIEGLLSERKGIVLYGIYYYGGI